MWVVIPVKRFAFAKNRLNSVLSSSERESFAQVMLNDVVRAVAGASLVSGVLLVSNEMRAKYVVERAGGLFLNTAESGVSSAFEQASDWLLRHGQRIAFMMPSDIPTIESSEIDSLIAAHSGGKAVTIIPDRHYAGTNGLIVSPPDVINYHFGSESFTLHVKAAEKVGIKPTVKISQGVALDIDSQPDLYRLLTVEQSIETLDYLWDSGIAKRLLSNKNEKFRSERMAASYLM